MRVPSITARHYEPMFIYLDLCVSAALDAVKERVNVPWRSSLSSASSSSAVPPDVQQATETQQRTAMTAEEYAVDPSLQSTMEPLSEARAESTDDTVPSESSAHTADAAADHVTTSSAAESTPPRMLTWKNFEKALKEITPSASEYLGSLAELRKWNDEFGEGRKERRKQVWGKGRFGFAVPTEATEGEKENASIPSPPPPQQQQQGTAGDVAV